MSKTLRYLAAFLLSLFAIGTLPHVTLGEHASLTADGKLLFSTPSKQEELPTSIERNTLFSDFLSPSGSKTYLFNVTSDRVVLTFSLEMVTEKAELEIDLKGVASVMKLNVHYEPSPHVYYVKDKGQVQIKVSNPEADSVVHYLFYIDLSDPVDNKGNKDLAFEGSWVSFYSDLKKDDSISFDLDYPSEQLRLEIKVFALCYEWTDKESYYMLRLYQETSGKSLSMRADLAGRYYIIIESKKGVGTFLLTSSITSPPWNQEWFWPTFSVLFAVITSPWLLLRILKTRRFAKLKFIPFNGYYLWFIAAGLAYSTVGSFNSGTTYRPLFIAFVVSYGLSLAVTYYAAYLDRKKKMVICPYCRREVNTERNNRCCGWMAKKISPLWLLSPAALSFLFFFTTHYFLSLPSVLPLTWWLGIGSILGGSISWWINRNIKGGKAWKFLVAGVIFAFLSFSLVGFIMNMILHPFVELEYPGRLLRIRITPVTLPFNLIVLLVLLTFLLLFCP